KWEKDRHEDPVYAQKNLAKINKWINDKVKGLAKEIEVDEFDVEGMGQFLPDEDHEIPLADGQTNNEGEKGNPKKVELEKVTRKQNLRTEDQAGTETNMGTDGDDIFGKNYGKDRKVESSGLGSDYALGTSNGDTQGGKDEGQRH